MSDEIQGPTMREEAAREWGLEPRWQAEPHLLLDLAGRLHRGDRVLPWAPTTTERRGTIRHPPRLSIPVGCSLSPADVAAGIVAFTGPPPRFIVDPPLADVSWRETTMQRWDRQKERGT